MQHSLLRRTGAIAALILSISGQMVGVQVAGAQGIASGLGVPRTAPPTPAERVGQALQQAGATVCASMIVRAAEFLFEDGEGNFSIQPLGPDINRWPIMLTIESHHRQSGNVRLSILTLAPAGTCAGSYVQVVTWAESCATLRATVFKDFKNEKPLFKSIGQSELTPGIQLYLTPSGTGCVSVKKELIG